MKMWYEILSTGVRGNSVGVDETVLIQAWGTNSIRVRVSKSTNLSNPVDALEGTNPTTALVVDKGDYVVVTNGNISCRAYVSGHIEFFRGEECILREYRRDKTSANEHSAVLAFDARKFVKRDDGYSVSVRFEAKDGEKIYGMGQYQQDNLNLKGCVLDLCQRNSQVSIPFYLSSLGYGLLWNNPGVGEVAFGNNYTQFSQELVDCIDYLVVVGDTPKQIIENYTALVGRAPSFPQDMMGLWQCKLRYKSQEELLSVAREYHDRGIPLDAIVIDFFHWTAQGDWQFDDTLWPNPAKMVEELRSMGIRPVVSVWPTVDKALSKNYVTMEQNGWLVESSITQNAMTNTSKFYDAFNPDAREFVWSNIKKNYYDNGIKTYWLDADEPEYLDYDSMNLISYQSGKATKVSNAYPLLHLEGIYKSLVKEGESGIVNLTRCAWIGAQKYASLVWSGDVKSNWTALRDQVVAGLNIGIAGIPWWTTDIGGFMSDGLDDSQFVELLIRWYQYATFSPVLRMHGDRGWIVESQYYVPNEIWSWGEEAYEIMKKYLDIRLDMKDYIAHIYDEASRTGVPLLRAMHLEFPDDEKCWEYTEEYMFGPKYLVAPVLYSGMRERNVYLPKGKWRDINTNICYTGECDIVVPTPIDCIPVFEKLE